MILTWHPNWHKWNWEVAYDVKDEKLLIIQQNNKIDTKIQSVWTKLMSKFFWTKLMSIFKMLKSQGSKQKLFAKYREGQQKDVDRAFRVLQACFAIIQGPAWFWENRKLARMMKACVILYNMIVEDERSTFARNFD